MGWRTREDGDGTAGRWLRAGVRPADVLLAVAVLGFTLLGAIDTVDEPLPPAAPALLVAMAVALLFHRRWPVTVFALTFVGHMLYLLLDVQEAFEWLATTVALGSVARARGWRFAAPVAVVLAGLAMAQPVAERGLAGLDAEALLAVLGLSTAVAVGEWLRTRQAYVDEARERARLAERSREQEAQRLVDEERLRIARDVHDVVAHAIASINVQASVGEHVADRDPARAREALSEIREASHTALAELRSILGMLRDGEAEAPEPRAGVDDLQRVAELARDAGLAVEVTFAGGRPELPPRVEQAVYRIVQESVTNAVKHAGDARLAIEVRYLPDAVEVRVVDDGATPPRNAVEGHGLRGLRERAATLGGTIQVGPRAGGGFAVTARLPIDAHAPGREGVR